MATHPIQPADPHTPEPHADQEVIGHVVSPRILIATALGLLILTVLTVSVASIDFGQLDLHELNIFAALGIAAIKASLVCLFFMHLRWDRPFNAFILVGALALLALFIGFAMTDSSEYKPDIIPGNSQLIESTLAEVANAPPAAEAPPPQH